jgi:hypothetical protein
MVDAGAAEAMRERLRVAGEDVRTAQELARAKVDVRTALIFEAIDHVGLSHRDAARACGISVQRLENLLAGGQG